MYTLYQLHLLTLICWTGPPDWKRCRDRFPMYIELMDTMFLGVAVDGSTAFVPGEPSRHVQEDEEMEEEDPEQQDNQPEEQGDTQFSNGSYKRPSSSSTTTGYNPNKRASSGRSRGKQPKMTAVKRMDKFMDVQTLLQEDRNAMLNKHLQTKSADMKAKREESKVKRAESKEKAAYKKEQIRIAQQLAREAGVPEDDEDLWYAVLMLSKDEDKMEFFKGTTTPEGRLAFIRKLARVNNSI